MSSLEPSIDSDRLDRLSLENALHDVEVATALVTHLTARKLELSAELRDSRKEVHELALELAALRSNRAYRTAQWIWQLRRGLGGV